MPADSTYAKRQAPKQRPALPRLPKPDYQDSEFQKAVDRTIATIGTDLSSGFPRVQEEVRGAVEKVKEGYRKVKKALTGK